MRVRGKQILVTGAFGGIGRSCAEVLAAEGAAVIAADVKAERPVNLPETIEYIQLDVSDPEAWAQLETSHLRQGGLDGLVNAAGIARPGSAHDILLGDWDDVIAVNQTGVLLGMRTAVTSMLRHGRGGSIVTISSIWGSVATPGFAAYHAAKGATTVMSKNVAVEYGAQGIRSNTVHPGLIDTPMSRTNSAEFNDQLISQTPLARIGKPDDVAYACLFLLSDEAKYVTGTSLFVDGGFTAL